MNREAIDAVRARLLAEPRMLSRLLDASHAGDVAAVLDPIAGSRIDWDRMPATMPGDAAAIPEWRLAEPPPAGWVPARFFLDAGEPWLEWLPLDLSQSSEPFFAGAIERARRTLAGRLLRCATPISALAALAGDPAPTALVSHVSRCGSTLVGRMLAQLDDTIVVSEPGPLDMAIRMWRLGAIPPEWLRGLAAALVRGADATHAHRVIKLDAWHSLALAQIAGLFPSARKLFLYRDPVEVVVSQRRNPGSHAVPGELPLAVYGLAGDPPADRDEYIAWVIGGIMRGGAAAAGLPGMMTCDYAALPEALLARIAPHFGIGVDAAARERALAASRAYSKDAARDHAPDAESKQREADERLRDAIARHGLDALYQRLRQPPASTTPALAKPRVTVSVAFANVPSRAGP